MNIISHVLTSKTVEVTYEDLGSKHTVSIPLASQGQLRPALHGHLIELLPPNVKAMFTSPK